MTDALLTRLHAALARALVARGHEDFDRPIRVVDIYKELIPYSVVRAPLGLALNADYEHALLRLLSGEGGLLRLEPAAAREELRREAGSQNPRTTLYRKFAHSPVLVMAPGAGSEAPAVRTSAPTAPPSQGSTADRAPAPPGPEGPTGDAVTFPFDPPAWDPPTGAGGTTDAPDRAPADPSREGAARTFRKPSAEPSPEPSGEPSFAGEPCSFCPETLPDDPRVRFCPYCGADQRLVPCDRCGAVLERGWRYCISCGHEPGR